jgi:regulator of replication initiation timing
MDDNLRLFLEKFAELERRVRKLAVEDRALREEVQSLRYRLESSEAEAAVLRRTLDKERGARRSARDKLSDLVVKLEGLKEGVEPEQEETGLAEVAEGER